jgi:hypothetical protein
MNIFECPICLDNIKYATVGSCMHHFCYFCIFKHCKFDNKCPMCKTEIHELKLDKEFDFIINNDTLPTLNYPNQIIIENYNNYNENNQNNENNENSISEIINNPGLTIKNNLKGPGVIITKIKSSGLFTKYSFKVNDILLFINEVPCSNHSHVMNQIMNLFQSNKPIKIIKLNN